MKLWRCKICGEILKIKRKEQPLDACPRCSSKDGYQPLEDENIVGD
ncbi:MAG: hypothetical protein QXQ02_06845 [Halobacteria archaeon]